MTSAIERAIEHLEIGMDDALRHQRNEEARGYQELISAVRAEVEALRDENETIKDTARALIVNSVCDRHALVDWAEFAAGELAAGCPQCQKERADKLESEIQFLKTKPIEEDII
jgi:hypothetical protein